MERFPKLKEYLEDAENRRRNRLHRVSSREEWAREMGVSPTSFSEWMRGLRKPEGTNLEQLATDPDIGLKIYDILGMARPVLDPMLRQVLEDFDDLSTDDRLKYADEIRQKAEANRKKRKTPSGNRATD